tara:strand:+ start:76 stop:429 length:354 start_codon:yes stop_codon:yes gene_type:complete
MPLLPRLKRRSEFLRVAADGRKCVTTGLIMQARQRPIEEEMSDVVRVGFTVSRKVGNSVKRNRARRRLRAIADIIMTKHAQARMDFVIIGRINTLTRPHTALIADMTKALIKLKTYR